MIDFRERKGEEREREINLLFHFFMHSFVDFCMCPGWASNPHNALINYAAWSVAWGKYFVSPAPGVGPGADVAFRNQ